MFSYRFMDLPAEVQEMIVEEALFLPGGITVGYVQDSATQERRAAIIPSCVSIRGGSGPAHNLIAAGLIRTCRTTYLMAMRRLYRMPFTFTGFKAMHDFLQKVGPNNISRMRQVTIQFSREDFGQPLPDPFPFLRPALPLRHLQLEIMRNYAPESWPRIRFIPRPRLLADAQISIPFNALGSNPERLCKQLSISEVGTLNTKGDSWGVLYRVGPMSRLVTVVEKEDVRANVVEALARFILQG